jgi:hypothetical protein
MLAESHVWLDREMRLRKVAPKASRLGCHVSDAKARSYTYKLTLHGDSKVKMDSSRG